MLAYVFWHLALADVSAKEYETALLSFQADLANAPPSGFASCTTYRISEIPWLDRRQGYEDWYFVHSSAALDTLNEAAVKPKRWDVHAGIATKMETGRGGLYQHLHGEEQPRGGERVAWLTRPRGIRYDRTQSLLRLVPKAMQEKGPTHSGRALPILKRTAAQSGNRNARYSPE